MKTRIWSVRLSVLAVVAAFLSLSVLPTDAEARRMGGGGSFGRSAPSQFQKSPPASPSGATSTAPAKQQATNPGTAGAAGAAAPRNRFLGPLGGLAAGLGLAALFGYLGFGAGMAEFLGTMLMIAAAVFAVMFLLRMLRGQQATNPRPAYSAPGSANNSYRQASANPVNDPAPGMGAPRNDQGFGQFGNASAFDAPMPAATPVKDLPAGFDEANFVNSAKKFFVTMQGVFDKGNVAGLREYCSDEVVDHLKAEIESRGDAVNRTDVVTLDAQLIGFETDVDEQIATVAFTGMLREEQDAAASEINELWVMTRPVSGGGWVLSGIHNL